MVVRWRMKFAKMYHNVNVLSKMLSKACIRSVKIVSWKLECWYEKVVSARGFAPNSASGVLIIIRQLIRRCNMSIKSLQGRRHNAPLTGSPWGLPLPSGHRQTGGVSLPTKESKGPDSQPRSGASTRMTQIRWHFFFGGEGNSTRKMLLHLRQPMSSLNIF